MKEPQTLAGAALFLYLYLIIRQKYGKIEGRREVKHMTRIRELRQAMGLTVAGLSYETRIHPSLISLVERRKAPASERVREGLSTFLGIPLREAFDDKGLAV